jgi:threonine/homoserine/homoserine lactone efflux protein
VKLTSARSLNRVFAEGVLVSALNPKIAVFFLAVLAQFVDPSRGPVTRQVLLLGLIYVGLALINDGAYAALAGGARRLIGGRVMQGPLPRYASGVLYLGLGVSTALAGRRN